LILTIKPRQIKAIFWAIDLVLAATLTFILVNAGQHLFSQPTFASPFPGDPSPIKNPRGQQKIASWDKYASLKKSELFGPQSSKAAPPPVFIDPAPPETTLDLEMKGIVAQEGDGPDLASIYNTKTRSSDTYGVGDEVLPDVTIVEIRDHEVILSRSGKRETLPMIFSGKGLTGRPGSRGPRPPVFPTRGASRGSSSKEAIQVINDSKRYVNKANLMEQVNQNLSSLINNFRTSPNIVDGKPSGLSIDQIGSDPISSKAGIKAGDIVKTVNGKQVHSIDSILGLGESLKNAKNINVVIEREGRHRTLRYTIRD
jgi:type II secretion system protein C